MKTIAIRLAIGFLMLISLWTIGSACGDKFLVMGRGIRFERMKAAVHPGTILIYGDKNAKDLKAGKQLEAALKKVGHIVQSVDDVTKLDATLEAGKFDIVILNLADTTLLEQRIVTSASNPAVLPIMYHQNDTELASAEKEYDCVLTASGRNTNVLSMVDNAVGDKQKGVPVECKGSK